MGARAVDVPWKGRCLPSFLAGRSQPRGPASIRVRAPIRDPPLKALRNVREEIPDVSRDSLQKLACISSRYL